MSADAVGNPLGRLMARLEATRIFLDAFTCPLRDGQPAPCAPDPDMEGRPYIPVPFGVAACPVAEIEDCQPWQEWEVARQGIERVRWDTWARQAGVPGVFLMDLARAHQTDTLLAVEAYLRAQAPAGRALVLSGGHGVGKSFAAAVALRRSWSRIGPARMAWFYFPRLVGDLLRPGEGQDATMNEACETYLAVFDDLGREYLKVGGAMDAKVDSIIYAREGNRLPTIFTTNQTPGELRERLSAASWDRLKGWAVFEVCNADSLRRPPDALPD